ncbi:TolC family protein [Pseudoxanthomonas sp. NC8]|nr:TolC family protein [Pseudoxanthomonas sp. NC8]
MASETRLQQKLAAEMVDSAGNLLQISENRRKVGIGTDVDIMTARANLSSYADAQQRTELAYRRALRGLELLLGRYPGATLAARDSLTAFPGPVPAGIPADALNRRPDMIAAERRVASAFDRVGEAKASMLPSLSLSAGYGRISNEAVQMRDDLEQTIASTSATAVVPLYTGGELTAQVGGAYRRAEDRRGRLHAPRPDRAGRGRGRTHRRARAGRTRAHPRRCRRRRPRSHPHGAGRIPDRQVRPARGEPAPAG